MNPNEYNSKLDGTAVDRTFWRTVALGLVACNLVIGTGLSLRAGNERTVVVPTELHQSIWVEDNKVSDSYLQEMTNSFCEMALNVSPSNVDYKHALFLKFVTSAAHGALQTRLALEGERLKRNNAAQVFFPSDIAMDPQRNRAALTGELATLIGDKKVRSEIKTWRVEFAMDSGRVSVSEFIEVDPNDPFDKKINTAVRS